MIVYPHLGCSGGTHGTAAQSLGGSTMTAGARDAALSEERARVRDLYDRLDVVRKRALIDLHRARTDQTVGTPGALTEQEAFIRLYTERVAALESAETRLCFGRLDLDDGTHRYIGRIGLTDDEQVSLLTDWRAPAAESFYQATAANPRDVVRRRHIVTEGREVTAVEDDVLNLDALADGTGGVDMESVQGGGVLMAALARKRTGRMHDIVATLQSEQDAIVRAPLPGVLVVDGGPGCGKTVVALHRAAYLLYTHRDRLSRSGVLVVGPNRLFLRYIEQVLPALGETAAVLATPGQLLPGIEATALDSPLADELKGALSMAEVISRAVRQRQRVPRSPVRMDVQGTVITVAPQVFSQAVDRARASHRPHNVARRTFALTMLERLAEILGEARNVDVESRYEDLIADLRESPDVRREVNLAWMPLTPTQVVADLWAQPDLLKNAAPRLSPEQRQALFRPRGSAWTVGDIPLLDEAAELLGVDDEAERHAQARAAIDRAADTDYARGVLEMTGTAGVSAESMIDRYSGSTDSASLAERAASDREWVYGHVVVDEAQELSMMMWRLLARRCPSLSMTVVGDLDQAASASAPSSWDQVFDRVAKARRNLDKRWRCERLSINYRTPAPFMDLARAVLESAGRTPAPVVSIREGEQPIFIRLGEDPWTDMANILRDQLADPDLGRMAVITARSQATEVHDALAQRLPPDSLGRGTARLDAPVSVLTVSEAKGLEFDVVVVCDPEQIEAESARPGGDLYVAFTRPTQRLIITADTAPTMIALAELLPTP
jgi:DNA helicase IV